MADGKKGFLDKEGLLNPKPERVRHPAFEAHEFFDPLDLPQVRYEMLRAARGEKVRIPTHGEHRFRSMMNARSDGMVNTDSYAMVKSLSPSAGIGVQLVRNGCSACSGIHRNLR